MKFRAGMRVKKVWGRNDVGITGTVVSDPIPEFDMAPHIDFRVRVDTSWTSRTGLRHGPGTIASACSDQWEPITDSDQSAEDTRALGRGLIRTLKLDTDIGVPA